MPNKSRTIAAAAAMLLLSPAALAATVTNLNDSGAGSLRAALAAAVVNEVIDFAPGVTGSIPLLTPLAVNQNVTIQGPGAASLTLDGQGATQVINLTAGRLRLSGVTVANGFSAGNGGGIALTTGAELIANLTVFTGNTASNGGAIAALGTSQLNIATSTFSGNSATGVGGGAIIAFGVAQASRSTFTGNTAAINGGAISVQPPNGLFFAANSTFEGNTSGGGGGAISSLQSLSIFSGTFSANQSGGPGGAIASSTGAYIVRNTVFVDNAAAAGQGAFDPTPGGGSTDAFFNNTSGGVRDDATGYGSIDPVILTSQPLQPLGQYRGPTQTMPPLAGSGILCAASLGFVVGALDQAGAPRTRLGGTCMDTGAVQALTAAAAGTSVPTLSEWMLVLLAAIMLAMGLVMRRRNS